MFTYAAPLPRVMTSPPRLAFSHVVCAGDGQGEVSVSDSLGKLGLNGNMCDAFMGRCGSW